MTVWREIASSSSARRQYEALEFFASRHARMVANTALSFGVAAAASSLAASSVPGAARAPLVPVLVLLHVLFLSALLWAWRHPSFTSEAAVLGASIATVLGLALAVPDSGINYSLGAAMCVLAGWGVGSLAVSLTTTRGDLVFLFTAFAATEVIVTAILTALDAPLVNRVSAAGLVLTLWAICTVFGIWLQTSLAMVSRRLINIGRAHNVERRASETEAQRLREARLLHDTALATLTLLAHAGVGVDEASLRRQAASDSELLSRLREGDRRPPRASGEYTLTNTAELQLGGTLESVKNRFNGTALRVHWHGSGQLGLEPNKLDAFIYALIECIENVRRHAQVDEAHVTLSDDGSVVRGVVTDAGIGFDPSTISDKRLGFAQSVVARLDDVGGTVRVFSAAGAGTTVVLEVTK